MADYKFNKPWAADSQNVQDFTEEEWGTGIVEKSLVSSSQVNGIMQAVTRRFLDLEAVEDRQYRYDFVVEDEISWQKFVSGDIGDATSVLIRKGEWMTEKNINLSLSSTKRITIEAGGVVVASGGLTMPGPISSKIDGGGGIQGRINIAYARLDGVNLSSGDITLTESYISNSFFYSESGILTGGKYNFCRYSIDNANNAQFTDCLFTRVSRFTNCTLVRCVIPNNTRLTNCTVIDCDYTVNKFVANLVKGTTFRNCNVTVDVSTTTSTAIFHADTIFKNCKLSLNAGHQAQVNGSAYDCEFLGGGTTNSLLNSLYICGNSYFTFRYSVNIETVSDKMKYATIRTDTPFYRNILEYRYYVYEMERASDLIPGVINSVSNSKDRNLKTETTGNSYFVRFRPAIATGVTMKFGGVVITPTEQLNTNGYVKLTL